MNAKTNKKVTTIQFNNGQVQSKKAAMFLADTMLRESHRVELLPYFYAAICAGIEGCINDAYLAFFTEKLKNRSKNIIKKFLLMNFELKFEILIPLISNFKYELDGTAKEVKDIIEIIQKRNSYLHIKNPVYNCKKSKNKNTTRIELLDSFVDNPYSFEAIKAKVDNTEIRSMLSLHDEFIDSTSDLYNTIRRKNFDPKPYYKEIT